MKTQSIRSQRGVLLLEALIAILLFSVGILAVVGLQANAIKNVAESQYRADASLLADQIIGQMWVNRANVADYAYAGGAADEPLLGWVTQVQNTLPNATVYPPTIEVETSNQPGPPPYVSHQVTVTISWQSPEELNADPPAPAHRHRTTAVINCC